MLYKMMTKAQLSVFLLIGIFILSLLAVIFITSRSEPTMQHDSPGTMTKILSHEREILKDGISVCLRQAIESSLYQEGFSSEYRLSKAVKLPYTGCMNDFLAQYENRGISVTSGPESNISISVAITDDAVIVDLNQLVKLKKNGESVSMSTVTESIKMSITAGIDTDAQGYVQRQISRFSDDHHAQLIIPKGVLALDRYGAPLKYVEIRMKPADMSMPLLYGKIVYDLLPDGVRFYGDGVKGGGVELVLSYDEFRAVEPGRLWPVVQNPSTGYFDFLDEQASVKHDPDRKKVTLRLNHFSTFGLAIMPRSDYPGVYYGVACTDSDGGDDTTTPGQVMLYRGGADGGWEAEPFQTFTDSCSDDRRSVLEYYCADYREMETEFPCHADEVCRNEGKGGKCVRADTGLAGTGETSEMQGPNYAVPTVSGFATDLQTGSSSLSIPLQVPAGISGLTPSLGLMYSSGSVDGFVSSWEQTDDTYVRQPGELGLGWSLLGQGVIVRDMGYTGDIRTNNDLLSGTYDDKFYLSFPGGSAEILYKDGEWQTNPNLNLKIEHMRWCGSGQKDTVFSDGDEWVVTTGDGTSYYFGNPSNENPTDCRLYYGHGENNEVPETIDFKEGCSLRQGTRDTDKRNCLDKEMPGLYTQFINIHVKEPGSYPYFYHNTYLPVKWHLRKVVDVLDNEIKYTYKSRVKEILPAVAASWKDRATDKPTRYYVRSITPDKIIYNGGKTVILFETTDPAVQGDGLDRMRCLPGDDAYCDVRIKHWSAWDMYKQVFWSPYKIEWISVSTEDEFGRLQRVRAYNLSYSALANPGHDDDKNKYAKLLTLDSVQQLGRSDQDRLPPVRFRYHLLDNKFPHWYLVSMGNGYGGSVEYIYRKSRVRLCRSMISSDGSGCTVDWDHNGNFRYIVDRVVTRDLVINSGFITEYLYEGYPYYDPEQDRIRDLPYAHAQENLKTRPKYYQFLGFKSVNVTIYDTVPLDELTGKPAEEQKQEKLKVTRTEFYTYVEDGNCFNPDARKGMIKRSFAYRLNELDHGSVDNGQHNQDGSGVGLGDAVTELNNTYSPDYRCSRQYNQDTMTPSIQLLSSRSKLDSEVTGIDYVVYDQYNNLIEQHVLGNLSDPDDDKIYITEYYPNPDKWLLHLPARTTQINASNTAPLLSTINYYDGAADYHDLPKQGLLTRSDTGLGRNIISVRTEYDNKGNPVKSWDGRNVLALSLTYDDVYGMYPTSSENALGHVSLTKFDYVLGEPIVVTDPNGFTTQYSYDGLGRLTKIIRTDRDTATQPYKEFQYQTEPYLSVKSLSKVYGNSGPGYLASKLDYTGLGYVNRSVLLDREVYLAEKGETVRADIISRNDYDSLGRVVQSHLPEIAVNRAISGFESESGQAKGETELLASPGYTTTWYDSLGRIIKVKDVLGRTSRTDYSGYMTIVFDPAGNKAVKIKDAFGRTVWSGVYNQSNNQLYRSAAYGYDDLDRIRETRYYQGPDEDYLYSRTTVYDLWGRMVKLRDPDLGVYYFGYDKNGNILNVGTLSNKNVRELTTYRYDAVNRVINRTYWTSSIVPFRYLTINFTYDQGNKAVGRLTRVDDLSGSTEFIYDAKGRLKAKSKLINGLQSPLMYLYGYNDYDNSPSTLIYPDNTSVRYEYDSAGRQIGLYDISHDRYLLQDVKYDQYGRVSLIKHTASLATRQKYDLAGRLLNKEIVRLLAYPQSPSQPPVKQGYQYEVLMNLSYEYDELDNVLATTDQLNPMQSVQYGYDELSRLVRASAGSYSAWYLYDAKNALLYKQEGDTQAIMEYNDPMHAHAPSKVNGYEYTYDWNGNLVEYSKDGHEVSIKWSVDDRPLEIWSDKGIITRFLYDSGGRRVRKVVESASACPGVVGEGAAHGEQAQCQPAAADYGTTYYYGPYHIYYSDDDPDIQSTEVSKYYPVIGARVFSLSSINHNNDVLYTFTDHLGSSTIITDSIGSLKDRLQYYPYGEVAEITNNAGDLVGSRDLPTKKLFTGQVYDTSTGLYYFNARYYNPYTGSFISADPVEGTNRYAYAAGNPIKYTDTSGNALDAGGAVGGGSVGGSGQVQLSPSVFMGNYYILPNGYVLQIHPSFPIGPTREQQQMERLQKQAWISGAAIFGGVLGGAALGPSAVSLAAAGADWCIANIGPCATKTGEIVTEIAEPVPTIKPVLLSYGFFGEVYGVGNIAEKRFYAPTPEKIFKEVALLEALSEESDYFPRYLGPLYDEEGALIGYKMDRIFGMDLNQYTVTGGKLPNHVIQGAINELDRLHGMNLVHGDIKLDNIMVELDDLGTPTGIKFVDPYDWRLRAEPMFRDSKSIPIKVKSQEMRKLKEILNLFR